MQIKYDDDEGTGAVVHLYCFAYVVRTCVVMDS